MYKQEIQVNNLPTLRVLLNGLASLSFNFIRRFENLGSRQLNHWLEHRAVLSSCCLTLTLLLVTLLYWRRRRGKLSIISARQSHISLFYFHHPLTHPTLQKTPTLPHTLHYWFLRCTKHAGLLVPLLTLVLHLSTAQKARQE